MNGNRAAKSWRGDLLEEAFREIDFDPNTGLPVPRSYLQWAEDGGEPPFRLKHHNPCTLPRRWQTHMR